jgi:hypothetical protein
LLDDGMHNDGVAGDSIFGGAVVMNGIAMEYYFISDNGTAASFLPARAEHEFFNFECKKRSPDNAGLVINEFLANNNTLQKDEYGDREDWLELYNNSSEVVDLGGCYLSDSSKLYTKWQIPFGTSIAPNSYLIVWADDDRYQMPLHTNFRLGNDSGVLYLSSATGNVLDSVKYSQQTADQSYGRYPNGTGAFRTMNVTFASENNNFGLGGSTIVTNDWNVVPNPSNGICRIVGLKNADATYKVMDVMGREYARGVYNGGELILPKLSAGIYLVQVKDGNSYREQKLVVQED